MISSRIRARATHHLCAAALALFAPPAVAQSPLAGFDAYVERGVKDWNVPGLAVAVVKDDSVVFAKGYGVRRLGTRDSVNAHTLFANASTTKAFTAFVVQLMADEGKLRLDAPVITYRPAFRLSDPVATRQVTIADLLSHRTGVPEADYIWYEDTSSFPEIMRRLSYVPLNAPVRSHFEYQNITFALAGDIAAQRAGTTWDRLVRDRILTPLGMRETTTGTPDERSHPNLAFAHDYVNDTLRVIPRYATDNIAPAGAMYSSVADMAIWMRFLLDSARLGGKRLLSPRGYADLFAPHILVGEKQFYPTARLTHPRFQGYGQAWFLEDYRGEFVAFHTGSIDGMTAIVGLIPERRLGIVVFANRDHAELRHALMYTVFDRYIGGSKHDWNAEMLTLYSALREEGKQADKRIDAARTTGTQPSLPLARYAGVYGDSLYGTATVKLEGKQLAVSFGPRSTADLEHWHYDSFMAHWRDAYRGRQLVTFRLGDDGTVAGMSVGDDVFLRRAAVKP
ncbi:MAG: serine hydrolase [Gemmatimonadaceae bacterium]|nr:serine hydrolase [Gemmatimonadaceae bacterium]